MFETAWTQAGDSPASSGALRNAVLADDVILVERTALDPATGKVLWTADRPIVGLDGGDAIAVRADGDRWVAVERRDRLTGAVSGEVAFTDSANAAVSLRAFDAALTLAPGHLIYGSLGAMRAFDLATGREVWSAKVRGTSSTIVASGQLVGLIDTSAEATTLVAVGVSDGAEQWRVSIAGSDTDVVASPRGGFFVPRGEQTIEVDAGGNPVRTVSGRFSSADGELVATVAGHDAVVYDAGGAAVDRIKPASDGDYVSAPGLCASAVVYYRNRDTTVWWHPSTGAELAVAKLVPRTGQGRSASITAAPTLTEPPRCLGSLVLVQDWLITAYRVPAS